MGFCVGTPFRGSRVEDSNWDFVSELRVEAPALRIRIGISGLGFVSKFRVEIPHWDFGVRLCVEVPSSDVGIPRRKAAFLDPAVALFDDV